MGDWWIIGDSVGLGCPSRDEFLAVWDNGDWYASDVEGLRLTAGFCSSREARSAACSTAARRCVNNLLLLVELAKDRKRGRDGTRYSRFHPSNFLAHHLARIVTAAVFSDAEHITDGIIGLKQRAHDLALAGDSDDDSAA